MIIIVWLVFCWFAATIASNKGNSGFAAFCISLVLSPLVGIVVALVSPRKANPNLAKCVDCGGAVSRQAPVCPHCGRVFKGKLITQS